MVGLRAETGLLAVVFDGAIVPVCAVNATVDSEPISLHRNLPMAVAVRERTAVWVRSRIEAAEQFPELTTSPATPTEAWAAIPLSSNGEPFAVLGLTFHTKQKFGESDRLFVRTLADITALALRAAGLDQATLLELSGVRGKAPASGSPGSIPAKLAETERASSPEHGSPAGLARQIRNLERNLGRRLVDVNNRAGSTPLQYALLHHLKNDGPATYSKLARLEQVTPAAVRDALVVPIVIDRLIEVSADAMSSDSEILTITEAGRAAERNSSSARESILHHFFETRYDQTQRDRIASALDVLEGLI